MIGGRRPLQGRKLGDKRIRVERPHAAYFRWTGPGQLTAKEAASGPTTGRGRAQARVKAMLLGRPLAIGGGDRRAALEEEGARDLQLRRDQLVGLRDRGDPAGRWSSAGSPRSRSRSEVSVAIAVLLIVVAISYRQVCLAYPTGGGSYSVSKRNFGRRTSLVAASALLIDYVMTVAVSTSSAVEQITSAFPALFDERVLIGVGCDRPDHDRQPPRAPRGGQHLRPPDVPVPVRGAADDRDRHVPDRRPRRGHRRTRRSSSRAATRSRPSR